MHYVNLGRTGLRVSRICLGMMSYGKHESRPWTLDEGDAEPILRAAMEGGINFYDTADVYNGGESEVLTGRLLRRLFGMREEYVVATKVNGRTMPGENGQGLSRKHIMASIDASLKRLDLDYVDLYQIHRWDDSTPIEETLEALHDVVKAGKARYIGASSMYAWQFSKALYLQRINGWSRFVSMQDHYNLLNREEEREMFPLLADQGVGAIPWSPLARGKLTREWNTTTLRSETDEFGKRLYSAEENDHAISDVVGAIAVERGVPRAQIALAWVLKNPVVSAPIVGAGKAQHIEDAVAALEITLTANEVARLEDPYQPHSLVGF